MTRVALLVLLLVLPLTGYCEQADLVIVNKSAGKLSLQNNGKTFATFSIALGAKPQGHKQSEGDERTPEGRYVLDAKNAGSAFHRSIHISYPNAADKRRAHVSGVDPGGQIMIHGQKNGWGWLAPLTQWFNWTDGCIALSDADMDVVWDAVRAGTPIQIEP